MKKMMVLLGMLVLAACLMTGCQSVPVSEAEAVEEIAYDVEIKEKMFIAQTNDIYLNINDYLGKTIKYEGMFFGTHYEPTDSMLYMVIRYGPGCCGDDGNAGFEVAWDNADIAVPSNNDWVEVIGELEEYDELGQRYFRLDVKSLRVLDERGAETVLQ